mgnify:CR=1 FL=1
MSHTLPTVTQQPGDSEAALLAILLEQAKGLAVLHQETDLFKAGVTYG